MNVLKTGIELELPQFNAALQVGVKLTLKDLLERLNAYTGANKTKDSTTPNSFAVLEDNISVAKFAARGYSNSIEEI